MRNIPMGNVLAEHRELRDWLVGASHVIDPLPVHHRDSTFYSTDNAALLSDWLMVGGDLERTIEKFREDAIESGAETEASEETKSQDADEIRIG